MPFVRIARRATPVSILVALVASLALSLAASTPSFAQDTSPVRQGEIAGVKEEMLAWIQEGEGKLIELARTVPEAKYSWTPGKGVRTFGEVFLHVAAANFGVPGFVGTPPPAGFKFEGYEHSLTKKDDIVAALKDSFKHMEAGLKGMTPEQMDTPAEFFGLKTTRRGAYMLLLTHVHEHLGQAIAYARVNKITPPWTARDEAEAKKAAEAKEKKP